MRKLLILIGLFLMLSMSGQILPGIVASGKAGTTAFDGGKINNGDFSDGANHWGVTGNLSIAGGKCTDDASVTQTSVLSQSSANMVSPIEASHSYSCTFTISGGTGQGDYGRLLFTDDDDQLILIATTYANGTHTVTLTVPAYGTTGGIKIKSYIDISYYVSFSIDDISLVEI
jgi:hypothetical protein